MDMEKKKPVSGVEQAHNARGAGKRVRAKQIRNENKKKGGENETRGSSQLKGTYNFSKVIITPV